MSNTSKRAILSAYPPLFLLILVLFLPIMSVPSSCAQDGCFPPATTEQTQLLWLWNGLNFTYSIDSSCGIVDQSQIQQSFQQWQAWLPQVNLTFTPAQANYTLLIKCNGRDGPGICGAGPRMCDMTFAPAGQYENGHATFSQIQLQTNDDNYYFTNHELGHVLGLDDYTGGLMSNSANSPCPWAIQRITYVYAGIEITSSTTQQTSISTAEVPATTYGIPGYSLESILAGLILGLSALLVLHGRKRVGS